jgi:hypothetical protein
MRENEKTRKGEKETRCVHLTHIQKLPHCHTPPQPISIVHYLSKTHPSPSPYQTMPIQHVVTYQTFCNITNLICNKVNDWNKFCTNTAHTTRKAKKAPTPPKQPSKHKTAENKGLLAPEPLLQENPHHFVLFPIHHANIWRMYKKAKASFWTAEEINLTADIVDWGRLSANECHFVFHVLTFFAASDGIINKNLSSNFATKVTAPEARCFYGFQIVVENIHSKTYSPLIDMYIKDSREELHLLHAIETVPCVQRKANWALKWCNPTSASFAK